MYMRIFSRASCINHLSRDFLPLYYLMMKTRPTIQTVIILEETCNVEELFPLFDKIHDGHEDKFMSIAEKYCSVNEFDMKYVLGLTNNYTPGAKLSCGSTDYVKLMVENIFLTALKFIEYYCDKFVLQDRACKYRVSNYKCLNIQLF